MWSLGHLRSLLAPGTQVQRRLGESFRRTRLSTTTTSHTIRSCLTLQTNTTLTTTTTITTIPPSTITTATPIRTFSSTPTTATTTVAMTAPPPMRGNSLGKPRSDSEREQTISSNDYYSPEKLSALEEKYQWVDWNAMAHHIHMSDVHFFDQEVPYVDSDFLIKRDMNLAHRLESANRLKQIQTAEHKKIDRLLPFGYWVTQGRHVRVTSHGKVSSVWTMIVAGDLNGTASYGIGKGKNMVQAEKLALQDLRRNMLFVPLFESRTVSHEITGEHGVCKVRMWPRARERGMSCGTIPSMVFECFGLRDVTAAVSGRALPHHQVRAIFDGLRQSKSPREEAIRRGVTAHRMFERGIQESRHPTREQTLRNCEKVSSILNDIQATMVQKRLIKNDPGVKSEESWQPPEWESIPKEDRSTENIFVPAYFDRKPQPIDVGSHGPAPSHPTGRKPQFKERLFEQRGLPHPKAPVAINPTKVL